MTRRSLSFFGQALNNTSEQSEVSLFCVVMRSFTYVQDDKFANNVNIGSTAILLPKQIRMAGHTDLFLFSIKIYIHFGVGIIEPFLIRRIAPTCINCPLCTINMHHNMVISNLLHIH